MREEMDFSTVIAPIESNASNAMGKTRLFFIDSNTP
jgi:hypothetical protein